VRSGPDADITDARAAAARAYDRCPAHRWTIDHWDSVTVLIATLLKG